MLAHIKNVGSFDIDNILSIVKGGDCVGITYKNSKQVVELYTSLEEVLEAKEIAEKERADLLKNDFDSWTERL